jgi:hypothetical protein
LPKRCSAARSRRRHRSAPTCSRRSSIAGRLRGQLDFATATQRESVELYRGVLLQALREAEDALAGTEQSRRRAGLLEDVIAQARENLAGWRGCNMSKGWPIYRP